MTTKAVVITIARIAFMLVTLACLAFTIWGIVAQVWPVAGVCALLAAVFGYFNYRDIRKWIAESKAT